MTSWRPTRAHLAASEAAAYRADESAEAAGLLLADSLLLLLEDQVEDLPRALDFLARNYRRAKAEARYRWAAHEDCLAQFEGRAE